MTCDVLDPGVSESIEFAQRAKAAWARLIGKAVL